MKAKEEELDDAIANADQDYKHISEDTRYAYITYADLKGLSEFKDQTVVPLKAPPSTKITVRLISKKIYKSVSIIFVLLNFCLFF